MSSSAEMTALVRHERGMYTGLSQIEEEIYNAESQYLSVRGAPGLHALLNTPRPQLSRSAFNSCSPHTITLLVAAIPYLQHHGRVGKLH